MPTDEQLQLNGTEQLRERLPRYFVHCLDCRVRGRATKFSWSAVTEWNCQYYTTAVTLAEFPFFGFGDLHLEQARSRAKAIRADLEARRAEIRAKRGARQAVGRDYAMRIDAYLAWVICGSTLIKIHLMAAELDAGPDRPAHS